MRYLLVLMVLLAGCLPRYEVRPRYEARPDRTQADLERELYECERDAAPIPNRFEALDMERRCMRVKGWRERK